MTKSAICFVLLGTLAAGLAAQAKQPAFKPGGDDWTAVKALQPGIEINVLAEGQAGPDLCLLSSVDDVTLICLLENTASDVRLVFPRHAIRDLWVFEVDGRRTPVSWAKVVLGSMAVGLAIGCVVANPVCLLPVLVVTAAIESHQLVSYPSAARPPAPRRWRRRLVYQAATP